MHLDKFSLQTQASVLGALACVFFVAKTLLSIRLTKSILGEIANFGSLFTSEVVNKVLGQSAVALNSISNQRMMFALTTGIEKIFFGVAAPAFSLIADSILLVLVFVGLLIANPTLATITYATFLLSGFILYKRMSKQAESLGKSAAINQIQSYDLMSQALLSYREILVKNQRHYFVDKLSKVRKESFTIGTSYAILPNVSKYYIEAALVLGALLLCAVEFAMQDAARAFGMITLFLAAGSRISPAILRIQQNSIQIKNSQGVAAETLEILEGLSNTQQSKRIIEKHRDREFSASIELRDVCFSYPGSKQNAINNVSLQIKHGDFIAIVGSSGAGKSTLVDLILGVVPPKSGEVLISNEFPLDAFERWPGLISYVPQDCAVFNCSVAENIALGYEYEESFDPKINNAISMASLAEVVSELEFGIHTQVGDRGAKLSGGQRQRLGIARALFTSPKILVLDEATSALDSETEFAVSTAINSLRGSTTLIVVAHRLSSVRDADVVVYLQNGEIAAIGTFNEVKSLSPDFEAQAQLMGL
jgi:ABC-type multidrug transport system fused ATPase/permease subunit